MIYIDVLYEYIDIRRKEKGLVDTWIQCHHAQRVRDQTV